MSSDLYIAPNGNDEWSGRLPEANKDNTDGPFETLERAKIATHSIKEEQSGDITVYIRGGTYRFSESVIFGLQDSAKTGQRITYKAYKNEIPLFSAGLPIKSWEICNDANLNIKAEGFGKIWQADIPEGINGFNCLFDGFSILQRSKSKPFPVSTDIKYKQMDSLNVGLEEERPLLKRIDFPQGAIENWENLKDVEVTFTPVPWTINTVPLESVDTSNRVATTAVEATAPSWAKNPNGVWVENRIEFLSGPGQWCVDTLKRKIYLWPTSEEPGEHITIPVTHEIIRVEGEIDYEGETDNPVHGLHFEGITFAHGERYRWHEGLKGWGIQHDWELFDRSTALVRFRGAENCSVNRCRFTSTGGTAVRMDLHCKFNSIVNSMFDYIGHMGILLCGYGPGTKDVNHSNIIHNNILHHCGEVVFHGHAIFVWQSGSNKISHNKIHHVARKAIGLCGIRVTILQHREHTFDEASKTIRWNEIDANIEPNGDDFNRFMPFNHARNNIVEANEISRPLEKLGDGSALNVSGAAEGNVINRNYLHHIRTYDASSVMRVDDWQRGTLFENNIVYKSNLSAITRKNFNHIVNNMFIDCSSKGYIRFASYPGETKGYGSLIQHNIYYESLGKVEYYKEAYLASPDVSLPQNCKADGNTFYCAKDSESSIQEIQKLQGLGIEKHSSSEDPLIKDISNGDFTLDESSPALKLGFQQISFTDIGITNEYPNQLLQYDYHEEANEEDYTRGRNTNKTEYAWW